MPLRRPRPLRQHQRRRLSRHQRRRTRQHAYSSSGASSDARANASAYGSTDASTYAGAYAITVASAFTCTDNCHARGPCNWQAGLTYVVCPVLEEALNNCGTNLNPFSVPSGQ